MLFNKFLKLKLSHKLLRIRKTVINVIDYYNKVYCYCLKLKIGYKLG